MSDYLQLHACMKQLFPLLAFLTLLCTCGPAPDTVKPVLAAAKWKNIVLDFNGPATSETAAINPFTDYRLDVTFTSGERSLTLPGFYAADGNAAETSADSGSVWRVNFRPDLEGEWTWEADFRKGVNVATDEEATSTPATLSNQSGTIEVGPPAGGETGRLVRTHPRYLQWAETGEYFLKGGADSPENFLGYYEFDGTTRHSNRFRDGESKTEGLHRYEPHAGDFTGGPTWGDGKGKNILGAVSYLAGKGINSIYMLTNNVNGDGKDVWPWIDHETTDRYDVSKLEQWERVFTHADELGMMLHFVLQETENETMLDGGDAGTMRRLYFRELVARFGHHRAVTWNMGEENGPNNWSEAAQNNEQQAAGFAALAAVDAYGNYISLHTHPNITKRRQIVDPLLGNKDLGGLSLQIHTIDQVHEITKHWIAKSAESGAPWIATVDEFGPWWRGIDPDAGYTVDGGKSNNQDSVRAFALWGNLMAGGAGGEWYFGAKNDQNDLAMEDWRSRDRAWTWTAAVLAFFQKNVPFSEMDNHDELITAGEAFCLAKPNETYLVYLPVGGTAELDLRGATGEYVLRWYNGATGEHKTGSDEPIMAGQTIKLNAPETGDWAALLEGRQ